MSAASYRSPRRRLLVLALAVTACDRADSLATLEWTDEQLSLLVSMASPAPTPESPSNRYAELDDAAELGRALFFDAGLSADGSISCASCHKPSLYFTDGQRTAVGMRAVARHTPSLVGAATLPFVMWDGRNDSLWSQALGPVEDAAEMGSHRLLVLRRIARRYRDHYERIFGTLPALPDGLDELKPEAARNFWETMGEGAREEVTDVFVNVGKALEAYERRLRTKPAPFDEYVEALRSGDATGGGFLSPAAVRGLRTFVGDANCIHCHNGPLLTDMAFHNMGLSSKDGEVDEGRASGIERLLDGEFRSDGRHADEGPNPHLAFIEPNFTDARGAFKTPTLRNVASTAPYGHAGQFASLDELLASYREERRAPPVGHLDPILTLVSPEFEIEDMKAFLESLTGPLPQSIWWSAPDSATHDDSKD